MAPKYELEVQSDQAEAFEAYVRENNWRITNRVPLQSDILQAWLSQVRKTKQLLEKVSRSQSEDISKVNAGVALMLSDSWRRIKPPSTLDELTTQVTKVILGSIPTDKELPLGIYPLISEKGIGFGHNKGFGQQLLPRDIAMLIEKYNLIGEQTRSLAEIAEEYTISPTTVRQRVIKASRIILSDPSVKPLVTS